MTRITPVILCGGAGTRLWPLSRRSYPKQFTRLVGEHTLLQACALRLSGTANGVEFAPPISVTNADFRFIVPEQLQAVGIDPGPVLIEPEGRNTAPAVLAAAFYAAARDPDAMLLVAPSDHVIDDVAAFHAAIATAAAQKDTLVTFGITPTRAETGYGYLELHETPQDNTAMALKRFVEKPDADTAAAMVESGMYLWNAGLFLFSARTLLEAYQTHAKPLIAPVAAAVEKAQADLGFLRLDPQAWAQAENISIDYAVMEKADNLAVVPLSPGWSDLGSWDAVRQQAEPDANGVVTHGATTAIDCANTLLRSEDDSIELVGLGLENILAVATGDAVLVADMSRAQDVKAAVDALRAKGAKQAEHFARDHRPWGHFETLALSDRFQVKRIVVKPGAALSLQSHVHRAEHWIVVAGTARVTINDRVELVGENQSVYIPLGAKHRMENPGKLPMVLIEVQTGAYLGEDDIIRYDDIYARARSRRTMQIEQTALQGVLILTPRRFGDARGFFAETWNRAVLAEQGVTLDFVQDNHSLSAAVGTVRGLHFQAPPHAQAKLVRCGRGALWDVAVDIRRGSPTYGQHVGVDLSAENGRQLLIPAGFAHGFVTRLPDTEICYKCSDIYAPETEGALAWDDPDLAIDWGVADPVLSDKDAAAGRLRDFDTPFEVSS